MATEVVLVLTSPPGGAVSGALANSFSTDLLPQNLLTNKGDLLTSDGTELKVLPASGILGKVLTSDPGDPLGIKWANEAGTGDVVGPASSINGNIALFNGVDGKAIKEATLGDGELLIGSAGAAPVANTIAGTPDQVNVALAPGMITLSTPQDIAMTSSPTFANVTDTGLTATGMLYADAGQVITSTAAPTDGQLLIGNTSGSGIPTLGSLTGTVDQIDVKNAAGSITLSTPQDIAMTSSVTFANVTDTGLTATGMLYADAGQVITSTAAPTDGQLLIGNTSGSGIPTLGTLTGTADQVDVKNAAGSITLSTPQDIAVTSSPTFANVTDTGLTATGMLYADAGQVITSTAAPTDGQLLIGNTSGSGIPTLGSIAGTADQITVTPGAGTITLSTPQDIAVTSSPTFANVTDTGLTATGMLYADAGQVITSTAAPTDGQLLIGNTSGSGIPTLGSIAGTANQITATPGAGTITLSTPQDIAPISSVVFTNVDCGSSGVAGSLDIFPNTAAKGKLTIIAADSVGDTMTTITNASQAGARTYTIPDAGASTNFVMESGAQTLTSKKLVDNSVTFVYNGDSTKQLAFECSGISTLTTRTVTVQDVDGTLPLLGSSQTWSGTNTYSAAIVPNANNTIDFGATGTRWKDVYFAGRLLYTTPLRIGAGAGATTDCVACVYIGDSSGATASNGTLGNTAVGYETMIDATTGVQNVAMGRSAMKRGNPTSCVAIGFSALSNTPGTAQPTFCVAVGHQSGLACQSAANCTFVGAESGDNTTTGTDQLCLGYKTRGDAAGAKQYTIGCGNAGGYLINSTNNSLLIGHADAGLENWRSSHDGVTKLGTAALRFADVFCLNTKFGGPTRNLILTGVEPATASRTATLQDVGADSDVMQSTRAVATQDPLITSTVILNAPTGVITTVTATTLAGATSTFAVTNSLVTAASVINVSIVNYAGTFFTNGIPYITVGAIGAGTFNIRVHNIHTLSALNGALKIAVIVA